MSKKVHCTVDYGYGFDKGIVCGIDCDDPESTSIDKNITCKKCLKKLGYHSSSEQGEG